MIVCTYNVNKQAGQCRYGYLYMDICDMEICIKYIDPPCEGGWRRRTNIFQYSVYASLL